MSKWQKVIFIHDLDNNGNCPNCLIDYADCPCPGPMQTDVYEYKIINNELHAKLAERSKE